MVGSPYPNAANLFAGVDHLINDQLGLTEHYRTETANRSLCTGGHNHFDGGDFIELLFTLLQRNWARGVVEFASGAASRENFRWHYPQTALAAHNSSREVTLEREFIRACQRAGRLDWSNQVPVVSGIAGSHAYKRQAIDLATAARRQLRVCGTEGRQRHPALCGNGGRSVWPIAVADPRGKDGARLWVKCYPYAPALRLTTLAPLKFYANRTPPHLAVQLDQRLEAGAPSRRRHAFLPNGVST